MNSASRKVSVVIPTYNRIELLKKAIVSLQNQTYKNMEIIIVDDCSSDNTAAIVKNIKDSRIIYIKHEMNKGGAEARNTGINHATGNYISFLDSDDQWLPEKLEKQMKIFEDNASTGVVYTGLKVVDENREIKKTVPKYRGDMLARLLQSNCIDTTSSIVVKRDLLLKIGGFNSLLPSCQDWDLYLRLAKIARFDYVTEPLVLFYQHQGVRISTNAESVLKGHLYIYNEYKEIAVKQKKHIHLKFSRNIAKRIFRIGIISKNSGTVKKAREISIADLYLSFFALKNFFIYFSTFINLKLLFFLYKQKINPSYKFIPFLRANFHL